MRGFAFLMALLGVFVFLLFHFSFWAVFGAMYMLGMVLVAVLSFYSKRKSPSSLMLAESLEAKLAK